MIVKEGLHIGSIVVEQGHEHKGLAIVVVTHPSLRVSSLLSANREEWCLGVPRPVEGELEIMGALTLDAMAEGIAKAELH